MNSENKMECMTLCTYVSIFKINIIIRRRHAIYILVSDALFPTGKIPPIPLRLHAKHPLRSNQIFSCNMNFPYFAFLYILNYLLIFVKLFLLFIIKMMSGSNVKNFFSFVANFPLKKNKRFIIPLWRTLTLNGQVQLSYQEAHFSHRYNVHFFMKLLQILELTSSVLLLHSLL